MRRRLHWKPNSTTPEGKRQTRDLWLMLLLQPSILFVLFAVWEFESSPWWLFIALPICAAVLIAFTLSIRATNAANKKLKAEFEEKENRVPKHYKIGDDGQIVEVKKPRKRSKNPHQR
jgi:hypothetical protein